MPTNIAGDPTSFPTTITAPSDGDSDAGTTWQVPYGELADRTAYLKRNALFAASNWQATDAIAITGGSIGANAVAAGLHPTSTTSPAEYAWVVVGAATGTRSAMASSSDGISWNEVTTPAVNEALNGVVYDGSNEVWIAVGGANGTRAHLLTTDNPHTGWSANADNPKDYQLNAVATDGAGVSVAAGGYDGADIYALRSTDGLDWSTEVSLAASSGQSVNSIAHAGSLWVAVGGAATTTPLIWTSPDGTTWTPQTPATGHTGTLLFVVHNGTAWFTCSVEGEITTSTDGVTWTSLVDPSGAPENADPDGMAADTESGLILIKKVGYFYASFDQGVTWSTLTHPPDAGNGACLGFGNGAFVTIDNATGGMAGARSMVMV